MRRVAVAFFIIISLGCALGVSGAQTAEAQESAERPFLHQLFGDRMVLQRGVRFPVWGWTTPGARVFVRMRGREARAVADAQGKWTARLGPFEAGGPYTLTVEGPQSVTLKDVLVGDVWLASGQSNMEMGITLVNDAQEEMARADYPMIRLFAVPKVAATRPQSTVKARWLVCNPTNVAAGGWGGFSAVAYFFGRRLHKELGIPIGLIHSSWGGTAAEGWVSAEALSAMPEFLPAIRNLEKTWADSKRPVTDFDERVEDWWRRNDPGSAARPTWADPSFDASGWQKMRLPQYWEDAGLPGYDGIVWFRRTFELPREWVGRDLVLSLGAVDDRDTTFVNGVRVGAMGQWDAPRSYRISARLLKPGVNTIAVRVLDTGVGGGIYGKPEQMRIELAEGGGAPVSLAGEWSYRASVSLDRLENPPQQGGNDFSVPNIRYNGMIAPLLPFAIKGAIWYQGETNVGRAAQYERLLPLLIRDWRTRFAVGDFPFFIVQLANYLERREAPADSEWARLREAQLHVSQNVAHSGLAVTIDIGDAKDIHPKNKQDVGARLALVALSNVYGRKLESSGPLYRRMKVEGNRVRLSFDHAEGGLLTKDGERLTGFAIAGEDGRFVWAEATIAGKDVLVSSPQVKRPVAVRYGWADNPACNLYNRAGLPASPFRTDDFPAAGPRRADRTAKTATGADAASSGAEEVYSDAAIRAAMLKVFEWQVAHPVEIDALNVNLWARAAFYAGVMAAYRGTGDPRYLEQATRWAEGRGWKLGDRPRHADDQAPGQTYLELYLLKKDPVMIAHTRATLDAMVSNPRTGREDWWWCDALFMSPPVLARLHAATGDAKYLDFMNAMWWDTTRFLFDTEAGLYYRDRNYIGKPNANGKKVFWARGNGWVMGGTVRVLEYLPKNHPSRPRYVELLKRMAASVSRVQGEDGLWRPSLLDPQEAPVPETSSTGFFCYAIAWGINNGHLDRKTYLPVVRKAWRGLVASLRADGKLGWVQQIGMAPANVTADDNQEYGSGAFLLAASEMLKLKQSKRS